MRRARPEIPRAIPDIDWPAFMRRHDMTFTALPRGWTEAPHFGNAMVGSMLYLRDDALCLEVFRADVHDHRDESFGWVAYSRPRLLIGHFLLASAGRPTGCSWRKDLWNAELTGSLTTTAGTIAIRHFVHARDMAIVTELTPSDGERDPSWCWVPAPAQTTRDGYPANAGELDEYAERYGEHYRTTLQPPAPNPDGRLETRDGASVWIQDLLCSGQYATAWGERERAGTCTHIASIANSYPERAASGAAIEDVLRCLGADRDAWVESHRSWWHGYYRQSFLTIPDADLESLYWQTIYRYGCCSRTGRSYVDTSGLWFQGGRWPYTTNDWNTQAAHWGVYAANRLEQGGELVRRLHLHRENLVAAVQPEAWREDSAYLGIATPGDFSGTRRADMRYHELVGNLPWLLHNAWWQYRYSMDVAMLRDRVFPLLRRAVNLYLHLAEDGEDGRVHLPPTYSPETGVWRDANFDLALFRWGCHVLIQSCERLGIRDPLEPRWRDVVERLVAFPADERGFMLGAGQTAWTDHRHLSHLLMIYPLALVHADQPGRGEVVRRSVDLACNAAGSDGSDEGGSLHAMVQAHAGPIAAMTGDGDRVLDGLRRLQAELFPNGLWSCAGSPCIESTLAVANIIQTMLIQSWADPALDEPGQIRVFPALPSAWRDVEYHDLRAEGAFLVSAARRDGRTAWVRITSLAGEPCRVRPGFDRPFCATGPRDHPVTEVSAGVYDIDLRRGETVLLSGEAGRRVGIGALRGRVSMSDDFDELPDDIARAFGARD